MTQRVFLAGATGAVGKRLVPLLRAAGHEVHGTTRHRERAGALETAGVTPVVVDVFDAPALTRALVACRPSIVMHQLTDLPPALDPALLPAALVRNARLRDEGTRHLVAAAIAAGTRRFIAQSIAWVYAPGTEPHGEDDALDVDAPGARGVTVAGVLALERQTLSSPPLEGIVLRYGQFYGPGTGFDAPGKLAPLHVDAAAWAALLAMDKARPGSYNVAEQRPYLRTDKARRELGWDAGFRLDARPA